MNSINRRQILLSAAAPVVGIAIAPLATNTANAVTVDNFEATDESITTTDGTISAIWIRPELSLSWEGISREGELTLDLNAKNTDSNNAEPTLTFTDTLESSHGSRSFSLDEFDLLEQDVFEHSDFEVTEPGESNTTDVKFTLTASITVEGELLLTETETAIAEIRVDRLPAPEITQFEVSDESNPAWTRATVDWAVTDEEFSLDEISSELLFNGDVVATENSEASQSSESGTHELEIRETTEEDYQVRLIASNGEGGVIKETRSVASD